MLDCAGPRPGSEARVQAGEGARNRWTIGWPPVRRRARRTAIGVRYPLALKSFDVALKPPAYTGVEPSTVKGGDLRVIEGTDATFQITFDSPPAEASLVVTDPSVRSKKDKAARRRQKSSR